MGFSALIAVAYYRPQSMEQLHIQVWLVDRAPGATCWEYLDNRDGEVRPMLQLRGCNE